VRFRDLRSVTRATTLAEPLATTGALADVSVELAEKALADHPAEREVTLLAVSVSKLVEGSPPESLRPLDDAVDAVRKKFGRSAVGNAAGVFRDGGRVPDAFRELAQADER
jgi:DNA polymerase-4